MTDLERARELATRYAETHELMEQQASEIEAALAAARREGAEEAEVRLRSSVLFEVGRQQGAAEMRERAAQISEAQRCPSRYAGPETFEGWRWARDVIADAIRALPLTPEEPT